MEHTVADLRARLKRRPKKEGISFKTTIDILLKLNRENFFGFPLIFTTDGQEVLTPKILVHEILAYLQQQGGRARMSEIARNLSVADETVLEHTKGIIAVTVFLNDAITEDWFVDKSNEVKGWLDSAGELTFVFLAEKLNVSLDLLSTKIITGPNVRFFADKTDYSLIGQKHVEILTARMRGLVHALSVPKEIEWMASQITCSQLPTAKSILKKILVDSGVPIGVFSPNETVFVPHVYTKRQGDLAMDSWTRRGWCELSMLRNRIGVSKTELDKWLAAQGLQDSQTALITQSFVIRTDAKFVEAVSYSIKHEEGALWIDWRRVLLSQIGLSAELYSSDYEKLGNIVQQGTEAFASWAVSGPVLFDLITIKREVLDSLAKKIQKAAARLCGQPEFSEEEEHKLLDKAENILVDQFGFAPDLFSAYHDLLLDISVSLRSRLREKAEQLVDERQRPSVRYTMDSLGELENKIAEEYVDLVDNVAAAAYFSFHPTFLELLKDQVLPDFVSAVFVHSAVRLCNMDSTCIKSDADRASILNALPNFPQVNVCKEALEFFQALLKADEAVLGSNLADILKTRLEDLSILVGAAVKKRQSVRKYIASLLSEFEKTEGPNARLIASKIILSKMANAKLSLLPEFDKGVFASLFSELKVSPGISTEIITNANLTELKALMLEFVES